MSMRAAYSIDDQSIDDKTTAATGESLSRRLFDPIAVMHVFGRVLRPNFHPTIGRHRQNTPDELQGPGCRVARFATGPSFSVGSTHATAIFGSTEPIPGVRSESLAATDVDPRLTFVLLTRRFVRVWEGAKAWVCRGFGAKVAQSRGIFPYSSARVSE